MTPAITAAKKAGIPFAVHEYRHDPEADSYGMEAANALGLPADQVFKTLVCELSDGRLAVAIVPVSCRLDLKALANAAGAKKAAMATSEQAQRATGYVLGGISPLGQRRQLATLLDESALAQPTIHVCAGRRGLEIELAPADLARLTGARTATLAR